MCIHSVIRNSSVSVAVFRPQLKVSITTSHPPPLSVRARVCVCVLVSQPPTHRRCPGTGCARVCSPGVNKVAILLLRVKGRFTQKVPKPHKTLCLGGGGAVVFPKPQKTPTHSRHSKPQLHPHPPPPPSLPPPFRNHSSSLSPAPRGREN